MIKETALKFKDLPIGAWFKFIDREDDALSCPHLKVEIHVGHEGAPDEYCPGFLGFNYDGSALVSVFDGDDAGEFEVVRFWQLEPIMLGAHRDDRKLITMLLPGSEEHQHATDFVRTPTGT